MPKKVAGRCLKFVHPTINGDKDAADLLLRLAVYPINYVGWEIVAIVLLSPNNTHNDRDIESDINDL